MYDIKTKRIYDKPEEEDGVRILVDRLWPRGLSKSKARIDEWLKDIAPSTSLRRWFNHDPKKWEIFKHRYGEELERKQEAIERLLQYVEKSPLTLLYAARDDRHNHAEALRAYLEFVSRSL